MTDLADRFRREGMADAAVLLVAKRINPTSDLDDWGQHLGLEHRELVAAVDRFKARRSPRLHLVQRGPACRHCGQTFDKRGIAIHERRCLARSSISGRAC